MTKKLQHVLNTATRIVSNTRKYSWGLGRFWRDSLHWLDVDDRIWFRVCPGIQVSAQLGTWIDVTLPTYVPRRWSPASSMSSTRQRGLLQLVHVRWSSIHLHQTNNMELSMMIWKTLIFLCLVSHATLRPSFRTSTFSNQHVRSALLKHAICIHCYC